MTYGDRVQTGTPSKALSSGRVLKAEEKSSAVNVFEYTDYRRFLQAFYEARRAVNPAYTMSSFVRKAGLGVNSRGYLKLVIEGKRNLTPHTVRRFSEAMNLAPRETFYFENLVYFNQAKTQKDKEYYFHRLNTSAEGNETRQFETLRSQYEYYSKWHLVAVRELVALDDFQASPAWIAARLKNKIARKDAAAALEHLERLELIRKESSGKWVQSEPLVKYTREATLNPMIQKFHAEMIDRAREALLEDEYDDRSTSGVTLSCDRALLPKIRESIDRFRDQLMDAYGVPGKKTDTVIQVCIQLFQHTSNSTRGKKNED